jgi:phosphoadenosine phosphosulfate reductase
MRKQKFFGLSLIELPREVRAEVQKPLGEKLERARQLLKLWAFHSTYLSCSFGKDSMVLLFLALQVRKDIPVVFVNTGVDYRETLDFKTEVCRAWNVNLIELQPMMTFFQVMDKVKKKGRKVDDGSKDTNICCYHLKEKPILKLTREMGFKYCFTGVTAMESRKRAWMACSKGQEYYVKKQEITKIHPLLYWQPQEVQQFIRDEGIPVNPVYEKYGIPRTGCQCCTCYMGWKEQLSRINPKLYKIIMERYFGQSLIDSSAWRLPDIE